jgi:hypothetical protein
VTSRQWESPREPILVTWSLFQWAGWAVQAATACWLAVCVSWVDTLFSWGVRRGWLAVCGRLLLYDMFKCVRLRCKAHGILVGCCVVQSVCQHRVQCCRIFCLSLATVPVP